MTDIHHQGHRPGEDVHHGDHGRQAAAGASVVHVHARDPKTGQPDFGTITYTYTPGEKCVELKSLKLYLQRFRNQGIYYENVTNRLLDDFVRACQPRRVNVVGTSQLIETSNATHGRLVPARCV